MEGPETALCHNTHISRRLKVGPFILRLLVRTLHLCFNIVYNESDHENMKNVNIFFSQGSWKLIAVEIF